MTKRSSEQDDNSEFQLSRRLALQLSSGVAFGGTVFGEGVGEAGASSEDEEDDLELGDEETLEEFGVSPEQIRGPTTVIKGVTETYRVNRSDSWVVVWSAENGTVDEDGPAAEVTFQTVGQAEVGVLVAKDGVPVAVGSLEVSVIEVSVGGPNEVAVGQRYEFEVGDTIPGVTIKNWSVSPAEAGNIIDEDDNSIEIEFEEEASPARVEAEYETDSGHTATADHEVDIKQIELWIQNERLVQTVEDTRVEDRDGTVLWDDELDPDFVASRNASIGFDLDGKHIELLKTDVTVVVERREIIDELPEYPVPNPESEFELQVTDDRNDEDGRNDVKDFVDAEHGIEALHKLAIRHGVDVPVFPLNGGYNEKQTLSSVEIRIESDVVDSDPVRIDRGTDFEVAEPRTLRVGFIGLKDPDGGANYGDGTDGRPHDYEENVEEAIELLKKVYPVDNVVAYRHDELMEGGTPFLVDPPEWLEETMFRAAIQARDTLEEQTPISESETVNGGGEIAEFDATILVVPHGYFEFHTGSGTTTGMALQDPLRDRQPQAACLVQDLNTDTMTTPHEVCHLVTQELYEGPGDHPTARRTSWDGDEWELDFEHARGIDDEDDGQEDPIGVRSVKFDLTDGEYDVEPAISSFMSYDEGDDWIDSRMFQYLIDNGFEPSPPETGAWNWLLKASTDAQRIEVISGTATIRDDGTATVDYVHRRDGYPMPQDGDGNVTLTLQSADGEELGTVTTVDEWVGVAEESTLISDTVQFVVPYPEEIEAIVFDHEGTTSTIDPRGRLLASAKDRIAKQSFIKNPEDRLPSLQGKLDSVDNQLQNNAYKAAYNKLTNDVRPRIEEWLHDDAAVPANYYTKSELLALIDDVIARLEALYDVYEDNQGRGPPEEHPGRGRPDDDEIEGGRGSPDEDEEFGRRPSDDEGHPGGGPDEDNDDSSGGRPQEGDNEGDDDSPGGGPPNDDEDDDPPGGGPPADDDDRESRGNR